ncbi:MAG: hypothetical protein UT33_C0008G0052 [Candidatus Peregrinibacteria bacterium GW2011_GWC2_39_14]|nr:MAG: hypothetical protein US92_C0004G0052 [Candidatus Peregrinibacteria bacterium GW2011_GWA2_38_36]KKR06736.1 MAG: hypothetical protein UT33_C0008G0052 [Candidatus Peregrinibacteria bacterium GW2011_GWC2_39_14]
MAELDLKSVSERPQFEDAKRRAALKEGDRFFFFKEGKKPGEGGEILKGSVRESGLSPFCNLSYGGGMSGDYGGYLKPGTIWGLTEEEVKAKLAEKRVSEQGVVAPSESSELVVPAETSGAITAISVEKRLDIQKTTGAAIILNDKGGIDLRGDIAATAMDLTIRIAHPISAFGAERAEDLAKEGFIDPILYRALKPEFDKLFDSIKKMLAALEGMSGLPEPALNGMRQALYMTANALTLKFLQDNAELIEFTQLATVTNGDHAARALEAIFDGIDGEGQAHFRDLPPSVQRFIRRFSER